MPLEPEALDDSRATGRRIGPYTILAPLGAGGMGVVYLGRDERLGREVAIKVVRPTLLADETARARFRSEALALARLNHPNIATVYDIGVHGGLDYLVMECVPGRTLRAHLEAGPLPPQDAISLAAQIAAALEEAHEQGVVHRDLKPGNVMITPKGQVKILDFGLAKLLAPAHPDDVTQPFAETIGVAGTPLYMSPEQAEGRSVDARTDLWSLSVILYEALTGKPPFRGDSGLAILRAVSGEDAPPLQQLRPDVPNEVVRIVERGLQKDAASRYQSASEMRRDLSAFLPGSSGAAAPAQTRASIRPRYAVGAALLIAIIAAAGAWFYWRAEQRRWAKEEALPKAVQLFHNDRPLAAFLLLQEAGRFLPHDPQLQAIAAENTRQISIASAPSGATVDVQDYMAPQSPWTRLGVTPLERIRFPKGYFRWKVAKAGAGEMVSARLPRSPLTFDLQSQRNAPPGMVRVAGDEWSDFIAFVGWVGPYHLPAYDIDRFEVTNRQYQEFVDRSGYRKREYWKEPFVLDGRQLQWDEAMALLRDRSGRAGPSTWEGGHYPEGEGDYPVAGVSWYEASAYAAFAGKAVPVFAQWFRAAPAELAAYSVQQSNIARSKLAPVGAFKGVGPFGTYDMAGNVREWVENATTDGQHFILGGSWSSQTYLSVDPEALPAFDRSSSNGFRCVRNVTPLAQNAVGPIATMDRDFSRVTPASDDVFRVYKAMYSYDNTPLDVRSEGVVEETVDWREEKISFNAAYGSERVTAYLFLPKRVRAPFQTVVFFPSARVLYIDNSRTLGDIKFFDYIVQSGRAVLYPVYKGTYERQEKLMLPGRRRGADLMIQRFKDLGRSVDYLRTRPDIDASRLAYLGVSMGAAEGVIYAALLEDAFKAVVFLDGGYFLINPTAGTDQADFAGRLKKPVLMVNGRYDFSFSLNRSQQPLFRMLGAPDADKRHVILDSPHDVTARRPQLVEAVLGWLDKYLGRVQ